MQRNFLEFGLPIWWIAPALLVALGLAVLLYRKKGMPWSKNKNLILGFLRFTSIFLILLLLLNPLIREVDNEVERPIVLIGLDNSSSIPSVHTQEDLNNLTERVQNLKNSLEDDLDYSVELIGLNGKLDSIGFQDQITDYSRFFKRVREEYSGDNLAGVVLLTDGIYNRGSSPEYANFNYPVISVGLGDTIPQRDVSIARVKHNDVAYSGNEFPIQVNVSGAGYFGRSFEVRILEKGSVLENQSAVLSAPQNELTFFLSANEAGLKHYTVQVTRFDGEVTHVNNSYEVFIEVLESKKSVLFSALAPHPDMKAIRSALEETGNYEVRFYIHGMNEKPETEDFDVQILFDGVSPLPGNSGLWFFNSSSTGIDLKNAAFIQIAAQGSPDEVIPALNSEFTSFTLNRENDRLKGYPPISVPFGEYSLSGPYEVLFYQQIGSVAIDKPVLAVFDDGNRRTAISAGTGIWQWKLQEAARYGDHSLFSELIQKVVQYLTTGDNKKQFRVTKGLEIFTEGDVVFFDVEIYDEIFQLIEGQRYSIEITGENGETDQFDYVFGLENRVANATRLTPGTYSYRAETYIGDKRHAERGEFVVNALQLEQRELTADHNLLRRVSEKSRGQFFHLDEWDQFEEYMNDSRYQGIIHSDISKQPLIQLFWVLILIAGLLGAEWVLRKAWGSY